MIASARDLRAAVHPATLEDVLKTLCDAGMLDGYSIDGDKVELFGDMMRLEAHWNFVQQTPAVLPTTVIEPTGLILPLGINGVQVQPVIKGGPGSRSHNPKGNVEYWTIAAEALNYRWRFKSTFDYRAWKMYVETSCGSRRIALALNSTRKKVRTALRRTKRRLGLPAKL